MKSRSTHSNRLHLLAVATTLALAGMAAPAFAGQAVVSGLDANGQYDQLIIKYQDTAAARTSASSMASALNAAAARVKPSHGAALNLKHFRRMAMGADVVRLDRKVNGTDLAALIRQIAADRTVQWAQPDYIVQALAVPNDTRFNEQWHYADNATGLRAPTAWNTSTGNGVVVAVVDSGIVSHPDLNANILPGYDMISSVSGSTCSDFSSGCGASNDGDGRDADPTDSSKVYHGTHVAGTVGAVTNNANGVAGVAYGAKIVPVRALGGKGSGTTSDIADAIVWASGGSVAGVPANANPAEVINLSLGGKAACSQTPAYQSAINTATANGAIVVVASGNSNIDVTGFTPASCDNVISVAASDQGGKRAFYSNYGSTIDITAPGGETCSPDVEFLPLNQAPSCAKSHPAQGILSTYSDNGYEFQQGTSMAAPHVAGVVALIQAASSTPKTFEQVRQILANTARPISAANCPGGCGPGLVDAAAAVAAAGGGGTPGNQAPVANFSSSVNGLTVTFTDSSSDSDGSIASRSWNFGDGTTSTATSPSKTYTAAGTYTVTLTVTDNAGATHTKSGTVTVSGGSTGVQTYTNGTDVTIRDNATVESTINVSGRTGNAPSNASVSVNIVHTYRQDLKVDLVAPDGSLYNIHNRTGSSADNVTGTFTFNLSSEALNGAWKLRVNDNANGDVGRIDTWSITF